MKDLKKITLSVLSKFSYQILSILVVFFLTPLMIKTLGNYKYGLWVLVNIIVNYYGYSELGITGAIERNLAVAIGDGNKSQFNKIFVNGLFLNILIACLVLLITFGSVIAVNTFKFNLSDYKLIAVLISIMGLNLALTFPFKSLSTLISANIRFDLLSGALAFQLISNSIVTALLLINGFGLVALAMSVLFTTLISNCSLIYLAGKTSRIPSLNFKLIDKTTIKHLLNYSGKSFLSQMADMLKSKVDEIVTGTFISISMVTPYSVANKLNGTANNFCLSFISILNPFFSKHVNVKSNEDRVNMFFSVSKVVIVMSSFVFFSFLFLGKPFILIWLGKDYLITYSPLIILAFSYFMAYTQSAGVQYMFSTNTHHYWAMISLSEGVINFIASLILVIYFKLGITGVALGTLLPFLVTKTFVQPYVMSKILMIKKSRYYSFFIKNILNGVALYLISGLLIRSIYIDNYFKIALVGAYLSLIAVLHFVLILNKEEKSVITEKFYNKFLAFRGLSE